MRCGGWKVDHFGNCMSGQHMVSDVNLSVDSLTCTDSYRARVSTQRRCCVIVFANDADKLNQASVAWWPLMGVQWTQPATVTRCYVAGHPAAAQTADRVYTDKKCIVGE